MVVADIFYVSSCSARLRKDYDDFQKLTESDNFLRESSSRGNCEPSKSPISVPISSEVCHKEIENNCHGMI